MTLQASKLGLKTAKQESQGERNRDQTGNQYVKSQGHGETKQVNRMHAKTGRGCCSLCMSSSSRVFFKIKKRCLYRGLQPSQWG